MLLTDSWLVDLTLLLGTVIFLLYQYLTRNFSHWKKKGVFFLKPMPLFGNMFDLMTFREPIGVWLRNLYTATDKPFFGIFSIDQPYLIVRSPDLIKHVLVKDYNYFKDRLMIAPDHDKLLSSMMFAQKSPDWKTMRNKMNPIFTMGKLRGMFPLIGSIANDMSTYIEKSSGILEAKEVCAKYSIEILAKCAFGIDAYSFEDENACFRQVGHDMFNFGWRNGIIQSAYFYMHGLVKLFKLRFFSNWSFQYLTDAVWTAIRTREETNGFRNDMIDIFVELRKDKEFCQELNFEGDIVAAQAIMFFAAGFETSSSTIAFALYEFCIHTDIQDRLRQEIGDNISKYNGITYEGVGNMEYLEMCVKETMRKYPALPFIDRRCNDDYKIPGTDVVIEKGTGIFIPAFGLHYDEEFFPEPEKYIPERFSEKSAYNSTYNYLPFGEGPRHCIGKIFGLWSVKLALVHILKNFELIKVPSTPVPIVYEPKSFILTSNVGLPMRFKKIES